MSPHFIILSAAMSLGGMASVGFTHYGSVKEQVANYSAEQREVKEQKELADLGDQVSSQLAALEGSLDEKWERDKAGILREVATMVNQVESMQSQQDSLEVILSKMAQDQMEIEFTVETLSDSFVPLRATGARFERVSASERAHALLPPMEETWKESF